jgi:hypothetical protein
MKLTPILVFVSCAGLAAGCDRSKETAKKEVDTKTETAKSGETVKTDTEVKQETPAGKVEMQNESYVGRVTEYKPGRKIEIKADDGRSHSFDLKKDDAAVSVEPKVRVGSKVQVMVDKRDDRVRKITIVPHA